MNRYRFKTEQEFKDHGQWQDDNSCPVGWADGGEMNKYLGKEILYSGCIALCESNDGFSMDGWYFEKNDYIIITETSLVGRWIKFLKKFHPDYPIGSYDLIVEDNPKKSCMILEKYKSCDRSRFRDCEIELMPEDWSPGLKEYEPRTEILSANKFIVGKWYKYDDWYIKYKETIGGTFVSSEEINYSGNYRKVHSYFGSTDSEKVLLEDLSEIQQYLPDDHPDKVSTIPEYVECITDTFTAILKDQIYKLTSKSTSNNYILEAVNICSYSSEFFKPSTKKAYDAQNKFKTLSKFKIGDWVTITQNTVDEGKAGVILGVNSNSDDYFDVSDMNHPYNCSQMRLATSSEIPFIKTEIKSLSLFPVNWCLKIDDDNRHILDKWRRKQPDFYELVKTFQGWLTYDKVDGTYTNWNDNVPSGYKEITFDQFKKNVLGSFIQLDIDAIPNTDASTMYNDPICPVLMEDMIAFSKKYDEKPLIENVQSINVNLRTKKKINKLIF